MSARWHTLYPSLTNLNKKLEELDLIEVNGNIVYAGEEYDPV